MMSTKTIAQQIYPLVIKSSNVMLLLLGFGIWQATKMTADQLSTLKEIIVIFDKPVGYLFIGLLALLITYSLVLWPIGKFTATAFFRFIDYQKGCDSRSLEHIEGSKDIHHIVLSIKEELINGKDKELIDTS